MADDDYKGEADVILTLCDAQLALIFSNNCVKLDLFQSVSFRASPLGVHFSIKPPSFNLK